MAGESQLKPDFKISLDGRRLAPEDAALVSGIQVFLTRNGCSACEVVFSDRGGQAQARELLFKAREIEIELGYVGRTRRIFDGELTAWRTELERNGPCTVVLRGMDRLHRLMRGHKTRTFHQSKPEQIASQIAREHGLSAAASGGGALAPFRMQPSQSDFRYLMELANLEGFECYVEGKTLHFARPQAQGKAGPFQYGQNVLAFVPHQNFRSPRRSVEVVGWSAEHKGEVLATASAGEEWFRVPGGRAGVELARFRGAPQRVRITQPQVQSPEQAQAVARAELTRRSLEFLTAEVEVPGDPNVKPGVLAKLEKVGPYGGDWYVTEADHFYDAAGYVTIFYGRRDTLGDAQAQ